MHSILLIIDQNFPNQHAFLEEVYAKLLPEKGYKVTWVFRDATKRFRFGKTQWHGTTVYTIPNEQYYGFLTGFLIRTILLFWGFILIRREKINLIQVRNWIYGAYIAYVYKLIFGIPYVYQISFPVQEAGIASVTKKSRLKQFKIWKNRLKLKLLNFIIRKADIVFAISEAMKKKMIEDGSSHQNIIPIPLGYTPVPAASPALMKELSEKLALNGSKVVLYIGTLSFLREPEFMIQTIREVAQTEPNVKLLVVGGEADEITKLTAYATQSGVAGNVIFTGKVPRSKVPDYIALADVCMSPIPEVPIYLVSSPTKLVEYIGAGKPVVASKIPEQEVIIEASGCGICTSFKVENFSKAIVQLLQHEDERIEMGRRGAFYASEHLSYRRICDRVLESYHKL